MRRVGLAVTALFMTAGTLVGQGKGIDKGTFEIGAFGRYNEPTTAYVIDKTRSDRWGGGGRIGLFFARNLAIELDASSNPFDLSPHQPPIPCTLPNAVSCPLLYTPIHLQLVYNAPLSNRFFFLLGGGVSDQMLTKSIHNSKLGVGGTAGFRWRALRALSFRVDGTLDILPKGTFDVRNTYTGLQVGASFLIGGHGCDRSADMINIRPTSVTLQPGQTQAFMATATYCGSPDGVVYRLTGPGALDSMSGMYTATGPGSAQVTAYSRRGKMTSAATITVATPMVAPPPAPAPPPPPPPPPAPAPAPPPAPARYTFDLAMVHFRFDHADLTKGGMDTVKAIAETLKGHSEVNVDVIGHTDWIGTDAYNMKLSRARAETVRRLLVAQGVADSRITVKWHGKTEPIADNKTDAGRAMNRRTEVKQNN